MGRDWLREVMDTCWTGSGQLTAGGLEGVWCRRSSSQLEHKCRVMIRCNVFSGCITRFVFNLLFFKISHSPTGTSSYCTRAGKYKKKLPFIYLVIHFLKSRLNWCQSCKWIITAALSTSETILLNAARSSAISDHFFNHYSWLDHQSQQSAVGIMCLRGFSCRMLHRL